MIADLLLGFLPLAIWLYLLLGRDRFWQINEQDSDMPPVPDHWPAVTVIVPARNEADVIGRSLASLLAQDYRGDFRIVLVDDQSEDGTGDIARGLDPTPTLREAHGGGDAGPERQRTDGRPLAAVASEGRGDDDNKRLTVLVGAERPTGWTGKLWAMQQGADHASAAAPEFFWFTDADIAHSPDTLSSLVARAEQGKLVLVSLMARLSCKTAVEHFLIPAFVFFFDMLYPFGAVNNFNRPTAAAAGGCMLARRRALELAGGLAAIRQNIIDDCALGRVMKRRGPIWLGLTNRSVSLRPYEHLSDIRKMVARSAYAQLGYSPLRLAGTMLGLGLVYLAPVTMALFAWGLAQMAGWMAWFIMALMFQPMLRFYRLSPFWGVALPLIGAFYAAFTLDSALQHWSGKGGLWKGRAQAEVKA